MSSPSKNKTAATLCLLLILPIAQSRAISCHQAHANKGSENIFPILSSSSLLNPRQSPNIRRDISESYIKLGFKDVSSDRLQRETQNNEFLKTELKQGDQIILENIEYNPAVAPIDYGHFYTQLTVQSAVKTHSDGVSFDAYNPATNRTKTIAIKFSNSDVHKIYVKRFTRTSTDTLLAVDPEAANSNSSGFARTFSKRGYGWMGRLDLISTVEAKAKILELYNKLDVGDELIFINPKDQIQKLVVLDKEFGLLRFVNSETVKTVTEKHKIYDPANLALVLSPSELQNTMLLGNIMFGQVARKPAPVADANWVSQVEQLQTNLADANQAFQAGGNMTERAAASPAGMQAAMFASQIADATTKWAVAKVDLKNIQARRNLPGNPPFNPSRIDYRKLIRREAISDGRTNAILDISSLPGQQMQIDVRLPNSNSQQTISMRVEKSPDSEKYDLVFNVGSKQEATSLFAHLLESAYGHIIQEALNVHHLHDVRMDMEAFANNGQLVSKHLTRGAPIFRGQIVEKESSSDSSERPVEMRISMKNYHSFFHAESQLFQALMWAHGLRF